MLKILFNMLKNKTIKVKGFFKKIGKKFKLMIYAFLSFSEKSIVDEMERGKRIRERVKEKNNQATIIEERIHSVREGFHRKVFLYIGFFILSFWFVGHFFAFMLYRSKLGVDYFKYASIDNGLIFSFEQSYVIFFSLVVSFVLLFLINFFILILFKATNSIAGLISSGLVGVLNGFLVREFSGENGGVLNKIYDFIDNLIFIMDFRIRGKDVFCSFMLVSSVVSFVYVIENNGDLFGTDANIKYKVEVSENVFECLNMVGKVGDYQVYLGKDGEGVPISIEVNTRIVRCPNESKK